MNWAVNSIVNCNLRPKIVIAFVVRFEHFFLYEFQTIREIEISIGKKSTVRGVIVLFVESNKLIIGEVSDVFGVTAGVEFVLTLGKQVLIDLVHEGIIRIRHRAFHLVVDDSLILEATAWVIGSFKLDSVTFLSEVVVVKIWKESAISIHRQ